MNFDSNTPEEEKDLAETPAWFVSALEQYLGNKFTLDVCALAQTAKCDNYYSLARDQNAMDLPWGARNFCNPPYSNIAPWVTKAANQSQNGKITALLIPDKPEVGYTRLCRVFADTMIHMPFRLKFLRPDGTPFLDKNGKESGPKFPVMVVLFTPWGIQMPVRDVYFDFRKLR